MKKTGTNNAVRMEKRFKNIIVIFIVLFAVVVLRLLQLVLFEGDKYKQAALSKVETGNSTITAKRGDIVDRNNVLLATSTTVYDLILDPHLILSDDGKYLDATANLVEKCFGISAADIKQKAADNENSYYIVLKRGLTYNEAKEFKSLSKTEKNIAGARLEESYKRNYTYGSLACSVLGHLENNRGVYGIEKYYNSELTGTDGKEYTYVNSDNILENVRRDPEDGNTVQSTLDYNIQSIVEKYMMETLEEAEAKIVAVTIQNPNTGEFYAMADTGSYDPNNPRNLSVRYTEEFINKLNDSETAEILNENWKNFCVSDTYEPGSTFKVFTVAGAIESGSIEKEDWFYCEGSRDVRDYTIHCAKLDGHEDISVSDAIAQSCNLALMDIAEAEGVETFCKYQSQFGFGSLTNVDLPNEVSCRSLMYTEDTMTDIDLATNSFGQSFNVTMVQMSSAFSSLINGGNYYKPYVVKNIYNSDGEVVRSFGKTLVSRPVSEETCEFVKECMRKTVTEGTGKTAAVPGYLIAGKTGTAEKGSRDKDLWVASFIGFAPFEDPQVVCYVVIDEPASGGEGSSTYACELFKKIMSEVLPYLHVTTASMDYDPMGVGSPEPDPEDEYGDYDGMADEYDNHDEDYDDENSYDDYDYDNYGYDDYYYDDYDEY